METVHVILWVVIVINIASIVFNMLGGSSKAITRKRFEQGAELAKLATLAAIGKIIKEDMDILIAVSKTPDFLDKVSTESDKMIRDSIKRIYNE